MKFPKVSKRDKMPAHVYKVAQCPRLEKVSDNVRQQHRLSLCFHVDLFSNYSAIQYCRLRSMIIKYVISWGQVKLQNTTASKTRANTVFNGYAQYEQL